MDFTRVGRTGVSVSKLCFGTMAFGDTADEAESARMYRAAREAGINFFDTANVYAGGRSEEILGRLIREERDQIVLASKVFARTGPGPNDAGLSRRHIVAAVEATLRRLGTDHLDFYFTHEVDRHTPIDETVAAFDHLVQRGWVLYPAVSNWAAWMIAKALGTSAREHRARFELVQPMYNLVKRQVEVEILPLAESEQLGVIPYSPLAAGLLVGRYPRGGEVTSGRLVESPMYAKRYAQERQSDVAERFVAFAAAQGVHPATLAVAWVGSHPAVTAPIIGARSLEQLQPSLAAADYRMSPELRAEVSALAPAPPLFHDRAEQA